MVPQTYYDVLNKVESAIEENSLQILQKINLKKILYESGGVEFTKCTIFIVGNEELIANSLRQEPSSAVLMPMNVVVMQAASETFVFGVDPLFLNRIGGLSLSGEIISRLRQGIENVVQLKKGLTIDRSDSLTLSQTPEVRLNGIPYALTRSFHGKKLEKVLDKILYVSKASKFGNEFSQLGVITLNQSQVDETIIMPLIGKLETLAEDLKVDPSVLTLWPYTLSVKDTGEEQGVMVSAINPPAINAATGTFHLRSFQEEITSRLSSTIEVDQHLN